MSDDTQIAKTGNNLPQPGQTQQPIQTNLNQYGNDSTQIAYVQHYDATTNQTVLIMQGAQPAGGTVVGQGVTFNYDCFNFFVLGTEQYDGPTFMVPKNRALTESTSDEMKAQCAALTPEAIEIIKTFPALFCSALPQQVLIDLAADLCIGGAKAYNELSRTHWAIKRINLVEILEKAGYRVFKL